MLIVSDQLHSSTLVHVLCTISIGSMRTIYNYLQKYKWQTVTVFLNKMYNNNDNKELGFS